MKTFVFSSIFLLSIELIVARPQTPQIDPAYLRDYYAQISQNGNRGSVADATPIFEQNTGFQPSAQQQISTGQQIRLRDSVQDQIRVQQQPNYAIQNVRQYNQQPQQQQLQYQPQYQQQNIQYSRPQSPPKQTAPRKQQLPLQYQQSNRDPEEAEDENEGNSSYQFGFDVKDDEYTNYQNRKEVRDGNVIKGSYSVVDSDGFIRTVTYTADPKEGFKADVVREPTDIVVKVPTPSPDSLNGKLGQRPQQHFLPQQQQQQQQQQYRPQPNKLRPIQVESQQYQYE